MADDRAIRERIRRNVGYPAHVVRLHKPAAVALPSLSGAFPSERPRAPAPGQPPAPADFVWPGHSYAITLAPAASSRRVGVTPRIGYPYQLRAVTVSGDVDAVEAFSFRLLDADDDDTAAVADPSGADIIEPLGDVVAGEDAGVHAAMNAGTVMYEPWYRRPTSGGFIKLKVHNAVAAARRITVTLDLDELPV